MSLKKVQRLKRGKRLAMQAKEDKKTRLRVHRTGKHFYGQVIGADGQIITSASSIDKDYKGSASKAKKSDIAAAIGELIAKKALDKGVQEVVFDRAGFKYHGRVKSFAEAARAAGLTF